MRWNMEYFIILAFLVLVGMQNMICVVIGMKIGLVLSKDEPLSLPNPVKAIKEHKVNKEVKAEQDRISTIMQNIENYDGTENGQKDVPWR